MNKVSDYFEEWRMDFHSDEGRYPTEKECKYFKTKMEILDAIMNNKDTVYECEGCYKNVCGVLHGCVETVDGEYVCQSCYEGSLGI